MSYPVEVKTSVNVSPSHPSGSNFHMNVKDVILAPHDHMIPEYVVSHEFISGALVALGVGILFIIQGIAIFLAGFTFGKRSGRSLRDCLPQPLPFGEVNLAVPIDGDPGIAEFDNRPVIGMAMPVAGMPPPPPPVDQIPEPVPPPPWPRQRTRQPGRNMVRVGILDTREAAIPINRFPNVVYWSDNSVCYHTRRDCFSIATKAEVCRARMCQICSPKPEDFEVPEQIE